MLMLLHQATVSSNSMTTLAVCLFKDNFHSFLNRVPAFSVHHCHLIIPVVSPKHILVVHFWVCILVVQDWMGICACDNVCMCSAKPMQQLSR